MTRVLKHTMIRKVYWKERRWAGIPLRLQLEDLDMKWPRYGTIVLADSRKTNFRETCLGDVCSSFGDISPNA